jgi:adenosylcobinamide-phosphate synthase
LERATTAVFGRSRFAGALAGTALVAGTAGFVWGSIVLAETAGATAGWLMEIFWLWAGISVRGLDDAASAVLRRLDAGDLDGAREALSMIVGRETADMDAAAIRRAVVETVAENTVDGAFSPIFYAVLGGAPLMWAFKAVSTGDSMVGYRNERYREFGWFFARLDDAANFIPARLSPIFISAAAWIMGVDVASALSTAARHAGKHESPNAGYPEAAMAGALRVSLGGAGVYHGVRVEKAVLGDAEAPSPDMRAAEESIGIMWVASILFMAAGVCAAALAFGVPR